MKYPKPIMTISELKEMGYHEEELRRIARSRVINRDFSIAWPRNPDAKNSPIEFDTEALDRYRRSIATGK